MSAEEKFILVDKYFVEKGLTLEEAYILGRVKSLSDENLIYRETNESIANAMGKSVRSVKNWINSLAKKGYLRKEYDGRCRMLYAADRKELIKNIEKGRKEIKEWIKNRDYERKGHEKSVFDGMTTEEKVAYLKTRIDQQKFANESDRDFL